MRIVLADAGGVAASKIQKAWAAAYEAKGHTVAVHRVGTATPPGKWDLYHTYGIHFTVGPPDARVLQYWADVCLVDDPDSWMTADRVRQYDDRLVCFDSGLADFYTRITGLKPAYVPLGYDAHLSVRDRAAEKKFDVGIFGAPSFTRAAAATILDQTGLSVGIWGPKEGPKGWKHLPHLAHRYQTYLDSPGELAVAIQSCRVTLVLQDTRTLKDGDWTFWQAMGLDTLLVSSPTDAATAFVPTVTLDDLEDTIQALVEDAKERRNIEEQIAYADENTMDHRVDALLAALAAVPSRANQQVTLEDSEPWASIRVDFPQEGETGIFEVGIPTDKIRDNEVPTILMRVARQMSRVAVAGLAAGEGATRREVRDA